MWGAAAGFSMSPYEFRHRLMKAIAGSTRPGPGRSAALMEKSLDHAFLQQLLVEI